MKILIDGRLYGLEHAGLGRYLINLVTELQKIDKKNDYKILLRKKYFNKLNLPKNWEKELADFRHYTFKEQVLLPRIIGKNNPDLVHFPHFNVPLFFRGRFVVTIHDTLMHKFKGKKVTTLPLYPYYLKRFGYHLTFKKAVKTSSKIIVPTKTVKKELTKKYELGDEKVVVTYEGFDEKVTKGDGAKKVLKKHKLPTPYFVYVGNAYPHKNLSRAVEAIVQLNKALDKKVLFAIASSRGVFTKRLEKIIKKQKAQEYVRFLGFVPDEELGVLYKESLGLLYPSLSEGFGLQGLEAMAAETLVVCSEIPTFKEVYKDKAIYFNPYDFTSIAKTLKDVVDMDKKKREAKIKEAAKFVKRYSWSKMAKQTLKVYEDSNSL